MFQCYDYKIFQCPRRSGLGKNGEGGPQSPTLFSLGTNVYVYLRRRQTLIERNYYYIYSKTYWHSLVYRSLTTNRLWSPILRFVYDNIQLHSIRISKSWRDLSICTLKLTKCFTTGTFFKLNAECEHNCFLLLLVIVFFLVWNKHRIKSYSYIDY